MSGEDPEIVVPDFLVPKILVPDPRFFQTLGPSDFEIPILQIFGPSDFEGPFSKILVR